ncbi:response regulator [Legionella cincinnatiensis]|uniref:Two-component response regulator n=1 Tax=Legionella cincinnatiensis TaxID=28085 RepID=A0A378INE4_9GAMM|nr:response regulator [Legionella cincinnatiensis]KTC83286.1 two-component response regulator [Legionella cincinnatiensis]STX36696.1 two-component response regulator [Legionella cincinnatiensis]
MHVLIIEDNAFNAFCLSRILETVIGSVSITVENNSQDVLSAIDSHVPDLVIIDGELNLIDEFSTHGPQLAAILLQKHPHLPLITWSDSEFMRGAFTKVFMQHNRIVNEYNTWSKTVSPNDVRKTLDYYFDELSGKIAQPFSHAIGTQRHTSYRMDCI